MEHEPILGKDAIREIIGRVASQHQVVIKCRIPDDHVVACETDAGGCDATLSSPASAYCS